MLNVLPILTSNTSNPGVILSAYNNEADAYLAFDGNTTTAWDTTGSGTGTPALTINLIGGVTSVTAYTLRTQDIAKAPSSFFLDGLTYGTTSWVTIDTETSVGGWVAGTPKTFNITIDQDKTFSAFRLRFPSAPVPGINISEFSIQRDDFDAAIHTHGTTLLSCDITFDTTRISNFLISNIMVDVITGGSSTSSASRPVQGQLFPRGLPSS